MPLCAEARKQFTCGPLIREGERCDPLRDQIPTMDPRERLGDHGLDPEVQRRQRGVFSGRALAVVVARDDEAASL